MCGIVGYVGNNKALPYLTSGLKNLEYRGYDSCGVAIVEKNRIKVYKTKGEVDKLIKKLATTDSQATFGIGHTRWATHGKPNTVNAHPHLDCTNKVAVVHNGIIENFESLKVELSKKGHKFKSQTDTEILPHLIEEELKNTGSLLNAVSNALKKIRGAYGIVVISSKHPNTLIAARLSSPLLIGFSNKQTFIASDQPALISWTNKLAKLKDNQIAKITSEGVEIRNINGNKENAQEVDVTSKIRDVNKSGFTHFMLKEIKEQPYSLEQALKGRFSVEAGVKLGGLAGKLAVFQKSPYISLFGCGSSYHAALIGKQYFQKIAGKPTMVENSTDLIGTNYVWQKDYPYIFISQSGETADVLNVIRQGKKHNIVPFGLVNVAGSSLASETAAGVYMRAGYEVGVAATKTFTAQIIALLLWAMQISSNKDPALSSSIEKIPQLAKEVVEQGDQIAQLAKNLIKFKKIFFLGRGAEYALSLEAALKIKEIAYLPAEGLQTGELKHGTLALVDKNTALIFLMPANDQFEKNVNALCETAARGGTIIAVCNKKSAKLSQTGALICTLPYCHPHVAPIPQAIWIQLLAFYIAKELGRPIDKPRHLAKSVTVE